MNSADAGNIQVISQVDESKFKDYTDKVLSDLNAHHQQALGSLPNQLNQMNNKMLAKNFSRLQMLSNRGIAGGHPTRTLSLANPLDLAGPYSQSQNFLKESF